MKTNWGPGMKVVYKVCLTSPYTNDLQRSPMTLTEILARIRVRTGSSNPDRDAQNGGACRFVTGKCSHFRASLLGETI